MKKYQNKQQLAKKLQGLFISHKIKALAMKLYSEDNDCDLVIIDKNQYCQAVILLESNDWKKHNNLSKIRERDKDFFAHQESPFFVHLHQAFSWNTIPYLDSETLWKRKVINQRLLLPSPEDELLIIGAHSLFENKYLVWEEKKYGQKLLKQKLDFTYMTDHVKKLNWQSGLSLILDKINKNESIIYPSELLKITIIKLFKDLRQLNLDLTTKEILNYFLIDWVWCYRQLWKKRPKIITFSGIDGSGKSTQAQTIHRFLLKNGYRCKLAHIGSGPVFLAPTGARKMNFITGYLALLKDIAQIWRACLLSRQNDFLIFDRFFYDSLVKINYKQRAQGFDHFSINFAKLLPQTHFSFLLQADLGTAFKRDKDHSLEYHRAKSALYQQLPHYFKVIPIDAGQLEKKVSKEIISSRSLFFTKG